MVKQYNRINLMENSASLTALIKMFWRTLIYRNVLNLELFIHSKKILNTAVHYPYISINFHILLK